MYAFHTSDEAEALNSLRCFAGRRRVGVYLNSHSLRRGLPHIELKARGLTLASFHDPQSARKWLQPGGGE
jgi:hypothetical protein